MGNSTQQSETDGGQPSGERLGSGLMRQAEVAIGSAIPQARNAHHAIMRMYEGQGEAPACLALMELAVRTLSQAEDAARYARMEFERHPPNTKGEARGARQEETHE